MCLTPLPCSLLLGHEWSTGTEVYVGVFILPSLFIALHRYNHQVSGTEISWGAEPHLRPSPCPSWEKGPQPVASTWCLDRLGATGHSGRSRGGSCCCAPSGPLPCSGPQLFWCTGTFCISFSGEPVAQPAGPHRDFSSPGPSLLLHLWRSPCCVCKETRSKTLSPFPRRLKQQSYVPSGLLQPAPRPAFRLEPLCWPPLTAPLKSASVIPCSPPEQHQCPVTLSSRGNSRSPALYLFSWHFLFPPISPPQHMDAHLRNKSQTVRKMAVKMGCIPRWH